MSQKIEEIKYCPAGHSFEDFSSYYRNFISFDEGLCSLYWEYVLIGYKVALKEIKDSRYDIVEFLKVVKAVSHLPVFVEYHGISKNPLTRNYILVMNLFDDDLHNFLTVNFWDLSWETKIYFLLLIASDLRNLHATNFVHCNLHSGNILIFTNYGRISPSSKLHPQSCYISLSIHTLHELHDLLEEIKSGKSSDPNLLLKLKSNESTASNVNTHYIDEETEIQGKQL
ncbi:11818_t:CDS:2 [Diversispora eburnea]|uniref:11818_t:CDS:1 n=1 Tax=Diversispora eburnea TaxID=1213867 RepID=A0A9N9GML1_9GLOM|nr:11818_t:CDS:2 [Diversispora eburnea]